jgi:hypothetical protein
MMAGPTVFTIHVEHYIRPFTVHVRHFVLSPLGEAAVLASG